MRKARIAPSEPASVIQMPAVTTQPQPIMAPKARASTSLLPRILDSLTSSLMAIAPVKVVALMVLGRVHNQHDGAPAAIFLQDKAQRAYGSHSTIASCNAGLRKNGPGPKGCAQNRAIPRCAAWS